MKSAGTPIVIRQKEASALSKIRIGGPGSPYNERWLQALINDHPTCLPIDRIEPGLGHLIPVCMELSLPCGYLDNLFLTPDGDIVIVEVKLWRNPEMRRAVVAQALDYASALFDMTYEDLEKAVLASEISNRKTARSLYDLVDHPEVPEEETFIDAVSSNLSRGRIVVLVVGDGIRSELKSLVDGLQNYTGFHFTFALVEMGVYSSREDDSLVVVPDTLAQTFGIERAIVRIDDERSRISVHQKQADHTPTADRETISSQQFFDAIKERHENLVPELMDFLRKAEQLGVYPEFRKSLILRWQPPFGKAINLGYVVQNGQLWTDAVFSSADVTPHAEEYIRRLADCTGLEVGEINNRPVLFKDGKAPRIEELIGKFDGWLKAIIEFQNAVKSTG